MSVSDVLVAMRVTVNLARLLAESAQSLRDAPESTPPARAADGPPTSETPQAPADPKVIDLWNAVRDAGWQAAAVSEAFERLASNANDAYAQAVVRQSLQQVLRRNAELVGTLLTIEPELRESPDADQQSAQMSGTGSGAPTLSRVSSPVRMRTMVDVPDV